MGSIKIREFCRTLIILLLAPAFFSQCAHELRPLENELDSPKHHAQTGFRLMEKRYLDDAKREFELALQNAPRYSLAHRGIGLLYLKRGDFGLASKSLGLAKDYAETKEDKALACVGFMRLYIAQNEKGWLKKGEENFLEALSILKDLPEAHYQMGIAYKQANRFPESEKAFKRVVEINKGLVAQANKELESVQRLKQDRR